MKKKMFLGANPEIFANAQKLRYSMTPAENMLWSYLNLKVNEAKFRRQHPFGNYIADFYCHKHKLVIEIDGSIHQLPEVIKKDFEKQTFFEEQGLKVLRFTNQQVFSNLQNVLETINTQISSPFRGRGGAIEANNPLP